MGSSQPSDSHLPFGYNFDPEDFFLDPPPDPAPGDPLLSDTDSKMLSSFFDDMTADHYNVPSFGEGLNFSDAWWHLPPQLMGTATSLGQSPGPSMFGSLASPGHDMSQADFGDIMSMGSSLMPPPPSRPAPPIPQARPSVEHQPQHLHITQHPQHPSADVLAAATLLQNGSSSRSNAAGARSLYTQRHGPAPLGPPVGHLRHQPLEEFKRAERINSFGEPLMGGEQQVKMYNDSVFGSVLERPEQIPSPPQRSSQPPAEVQFQWGSDPRFNQHTAYQPDSESETFDAMQAAQLRYLGCIEPSRSATNTRPSSPNGEYSVMPGRNVVKAGHLEDPDAPPRKRRKSQNTKDDGDDDDDSTEGSSGAIKGSKKRKGKADGAGGSENGTAGKRRKSGTGAKPARENLTEAQKRENHIRSEQKRRTLIKEGFDDLCDLVPGLKGGGFSKSTMLTMAAEWLEDMLGGNQQLSAQLEALGGR